MKHNGKIMNCYTVVLRKNGDYWIALCLENGLVGQDTSKEDLIEKFRKAIDSVEGVCKTEVDVKNEPLSIKELHQFLKVDGEKPASEAYELRTVYA